MKTLFPLIALFITTSAFAKSATISQLKEDVDFASQALGDNCSIDTASHGGALEIRASDDKTKLSWNLPRILLPKNRVKLLLNMLIIASQTIPRGGMLTVDAIGEGESMSFRITAAGLNARIPQALTGLLEGRSESGTVDAHAIQPFYTGLLARSCGLGVTLAPEGDRILVTAA